jgi:hypothetical protein
MAGPAGSIIIIQLQLGVQQVADCIMLQVVLVPEHLEIKEAAAVAESMAVMDLLLHQPAVMALAQ